MKLPFCVQNDRNPVTSCYACKVFPCTRRALGDCTSHGGGVCSFHFWFC